MKKRLASKVDGFYEIGESALPLYWWAEPHPPERLTAWLTARRMRRECDVRFPIRTGRFQGDAVSFSVWSERIVNTLKETGASGWSSLPARVSRNGKSIKGYHLIHVSGRGGSLDTKRSRAFTDASGLLRHEGVFMVESEWDGSDLFLIPELGTMIFATERVALALRNAKLRNFSVTPAADVWG